MESLNLQLQRLQKDYLIIIRGATGIFLTAVRPGLPYVISMFNADPSGKMMGLAVKRIWSLMVEVMTAILMQDMASLLAQHHHQHHQPRPGGASRRNL